MSLLFSKQPTKREFLDSFFVNQGLSKFSALPDHNYSGCHKTSSNNWFEFRRPNASLVRDFMVSNNSFNPDGNRSGQYFALRLMPIYIGIDVVMNEETYFPRLNDFNFDFISENVGLIRGSLSQHICIKRMTPLLPAMSVGYSGLN